MSEIDLLYRRITELNNELGKEIKISAQLRAAQDYDGKRLADAYTKLAELRLALDEARRVIELVKEYTDNDNLYDHAIAWLEKWKVKP